MPETDTLETVSATVAPLNLEWVTTNPFDDDTPLMCGIDTPDYCESCQ